MSKTLLKKEIHSMTKAQLEELILDAYDFRKEIKQYFDYFLNPNVEKLYDTYSAAVCKELSRGKRGNSKARITVLRRLLREFAAYRPGYDMEINLLVYTIRIAMAAERLLRFPNTLSSGIGDMLLQTLALADRNLVADNVLEQLTAILNSADTGTRYFRQYLQRRLEEYSPS